MSEHRRFGDRKDGRRLRSISPTSVVSPYIMGTRAGSQNYLIDTVKTDSIDKYLIDKRAEGLKGISMMHVIIASYIRTVSCLPAINRFIAGQRVYSRGRKIIISLTIKKDFNIDSPDTVIKVEFSPDATIYDVYEKFNQAIENYRNNPGGNFDLAAGIFRYFPGLGLRFAIGTLRFLDYFGIMPKTIVDLSPFHGSMFITSMGSLGIPAIYHHLYDFGNMPLFISFGAKKRVNELSDEGKVEKHSYIDVTYVMDERICDGYYFAAAYKCMRKIFKNPAVLDRSPEVIKDDVE